MSKSIAAGIVIVASIFTGSMVLTFSVGCVDSAPDSDELAKLRSEIRVLKKRVDVVTIDYDAQEKQALKSLVDYAKKQEAVMRENHRLTSGDGYTLALAQFHHALAQAEFAFADRDYEKCDEHFRRAVVVGKKTHEIAFVRFLAGDLQFPHVFQIRRAVTKTQLEQSRAKRMIAAFD